MKRIIFIAVIAQFALFCATSVFASVSFYIDAAIYRPAIKVNSGSDLRARNPVASNAIEWVPASHQLVEIYQSHWSGPQLCGLAYTNSEGKFPDGTSFSCGANKPNSVQLIVRGDSNRGFRVGSNSPYPHEQLSVAYAYKWVSPEKPFPSSGNTIRFDIKLGEPDLRFENLGFRAAALFEILDVLYQELNLGIAQVDMTRRWVPLYSKWIINDAVSGGFGLSAPWTFWDTVHMPAGSGTGYVLGSAAHELGHILYNRSHSGWDHYFGEVWEYLRNHDSCQVNSTRFASYEGFANAVRNIAWAHHAGGLASSAYTAPEQTCATNGINREGNVTEFYSAAFAGQPMERLPAALDHWTTRRLGANEYAFPPTLDLLDIVSSAGMNAEDLSQLWAASMRALCSGTHDGAPAFCGSRRFRCMVNEEMLSSNDPFSPEFRAPSANCQPGISTISQIRKVGAWFSTTVSVEFTPAEFVDQYWIFWKSSKGQSALEPADVSYQDPNQTLHRRVRVPKCQYISLQIVTQNDYGWSYGPWRELAPLGWFCGKVKRDTLKQVERLTTKP